MHVNKTRALAGMAMITALSVILQILGTIISVNTLFFTALAAYLIGYSINKYQMSYAGIQLAACTLLDFVLNPDKMHWILYLFLGGYIFLCELIFQKWNHVEDVKQKKRVQLFYNWILFNLLYIPVVIFFASLLSDAVMFQGVTGKVLMIVAGQVGWFIYDKAYCQFFKWIQERRL